MGVIIHVYARANIQLDPEALSYNPFISDRSLTMARMVLKIRIPDSVINLVFSLAITTCMFHGFVRIPPDVDQADVVFWTYAKARTANGLVSISSNTTPNHIPVLGITIFSASAFSHCAARKKWPPAFERLTSCTDEHQYRLFCKLPLLS